MTIDFTQDDNSFAERLVYALSPAQPIRTIELLRGRERELETIRRALIMPGRHIFVYGDRGVGKSSLARTAAYQYQSADAEPITVSAGKGDTLASVIANVVHEALKRSRLQRTKENKVGSLSFGGISLGVGKEITQLDILDQIRTTSDAVALLSEAAGLHSKMPIVVVDEFDQIESMEERNKFAALIKQIGDQDVPIKFIFTGVGSSLQQLLGAHQSAYRQLETVELDRLGWDGRREIALHAAHKFGLDLDNNIAWRLAAVSDGFPSFVHLIVEKMLWEAYSDEKVVETLGHRQYLPGLRAAINSIVAELRMPYEKAVLHRAAHFEAIVWATADGEDLFRPIADMYESYKVVCRKRFEDEVMSRPKFAEHLRSLRTAGYGNVLEAVPNRKGWYTYHEKMLRGYVRMQAEAGGVELSGEREAPRQHMHVAVGARRGYRGPSVPPSVRLRGDSESG